MADEQKRKAGRPALTQGFKAIRAQVSLDQVTIDRAKALGEGNVSLGIRRALNPGPNLDLKADEAANASGSSASEPALD